MPAQSDWRILLIDDEEDILDVVGLALRDAGYHVSTAPHGEAGLAACADDPLHIVITDIRVPGINATDAMPDGGLLEIRSRASEDRSAVVITVTDNGGGIAPEHLPHIFDPFFTTQKEGQGTGLGLSTTSGIIDAGSRQCQGGDFYHHAAASMTPNAA